MAEELSGDDSRERVTLAEFAGQWLEHRRAHVKPSTATKYENDLRLHILPVLGSLYVDSIRPRDVKAFISRQLKKSAGWSVANRLRLLRVISKDAVAEGLTDMDFCARVRLPKVSKYTEDEPNCLTAEQLRQVATAMPADWYPLFATMAFTGLRWGEVSGLRWADLDRGRGVIRVRRNNWKGTITSPKTEGSARTVPMAETLAGILDGHRVRMVVEKHPGLAAGWIFPTEHGTLHRGTPFGKILRRAVQAAGLEMRLTPHGLRRTFNDLARRVASTVVVRAITGHVTETMTDHYSNIDAGEKRAVQDAVVALVESDRDGSAESRAEPSAGPAGEKNLPQREEKREHRLPREPQEPMKPE